MAEPKTTERRARALWIISAAAYLLAFIAPFWGGCALPEAVDRFPAIVNLSSCVNWQCSISQSYLVGLLFTIPLSVHYATITNVSILTGNLRNFAAVVFLTSISVMWIAVGVPIDDINRSRWISDLYCDFQIFSFLILGVINFTILGMTMMNAIFIKALVTNF